MRTKNFSFQAVTLLLCLGALVLPAGDAGAAPQNELLVKYVAGAHGLDPADPGWAAAPEFVSDLRHVDWIDNGCGGGSLYERRFLYVKALHNGTEIFFRYRWADATENRAVDDTNKYGDAVCIQVPFTRMGDGNTTIQMGSQNNPVNILFWRADLAQPQNIVAGGRGTIHPSSDGQNLVKYDNYANGEWTVIVGRPMAAASVNQVTFARGTATNMVFANWEASDCERDGHKVISQWLAMRIE